MVLPEEGMKKNHISLLSFMLILFIPAACSGGKNIKNGTISAAGSGVTPAGIWEDSQTGSKHTIVRDGQGYKVESIITDGYDEVSEVMEIRSSVYADGKISWSYFVPSTGYLVNFESVSYDENTMHVLWTNNDGKGNTLSGKETLIRIVNGKRSVEPEAGDEEYNNYNDTPDTELNDNPGEEDRNGDDNSSLPEDEINNTGD
jgi:hypothetical protein